MAGAFDHDLHVVLPGDFGEFAQGLQLGELRLIAGVGDAAGAQAIAQGEADVVLREDLADVLETFVQHVLLVILDHPLGQDGSAAAHDSGDALRGHRDVLDEHAGMDGHVVDALLGLLLDDFEHDFAGEVLDPADAAERFVDRDGADGDGRILDDGLADARDIAAGREIHDGVGAEFDGVAQFLELLLDVGGGGGVADVRIDLATWTPRRCTSARDWCG